MKHSLLVDNSMHTLLSILTKRNILMKIFLTYSGKLSVILALALFTTISTFAQLSLRKAVDTDGDNKADFTVFRDSNSVWYTLKSNGGNSAQQFGIPNDDWMTPGDYDGDGKGDVSVWRDNRSLVSFE